MGLCFSNIHIKKNNNFSTEVLMDMLREEMKAKGFNELQSSEEAEISLCVFSPENSQWVSVASDCYNFSDAESTKSAAVPFSEKFGTDVIAVMCLDSDYLMMNLINTEKHIDGWINSGDLYGEKLPRRTSIAPWKSVVSDYEKFSSVVKDKSVFAEDVFYEAAALLGMDTAQCALQPDDSHLQQDENLRRLYFSAPNGIEKELPVLKMNISPGRPCSAEENTAVFVNNKGGSSKGIAVMFWGGIFEDDEVIIERATFESDYGSEKCMVVPITLEKRKATNGETVLYWEDKDFVIPKAVNQSLPWEKMNDLEFKKEFGVRFFVSGNKRKFLDVRVSIIPLENREGSETWFVYRYDKTKKRYIEKYNKSWISIGFNSPDMLLNPDDYDL
ncbi:MAG: hypothetical protein IJZ47_10835 [Oscillospiraceae bacterium]|nr:hypothetical protein [Oscillospiraceae bacterium]